MKKKKIILIICSVLFVFFLMGILTNDEFGTLPIQTKIIIALGLVFSSFLPLLFYYLIFKISYIKGKKDVIEGCLSIDDFHKSEQYFRDILSKYDPIELSYIDDFDINFPKDIIVVLLSLKNKDKIDFEDNKIVIKNEDNLTNAQRYVMDCIRDGKIVKTNLLQLKSIVQLDAKDHGLLESRFSINIKGILKLFYNIFLIPSILVLFIIACISFMEKIYKLNNIYINIFLIVILCVVFIMLFIKWMGWPIYLFSYFLNKTSNPYKRSQLGDEINKKLEGLKIFLKDFSNLDKSSYEEVVLWNDYLIYSVLFNQNVKVIKEMEKYIVD